MRSFLRVRRRSMVLALVLVLVPGAVPAGAQPLDISASAAVTWAGWGSWDGPPATELGDSSVGFIAHPALVVVWRGQPGWTFRAAGDTNSFGFDSGEPTPDGHPAVRVAVSRGDLTLAFAYVPATREATVNGISFQMPDGHNVVLVDDADTEAPRMATLGIEPGAPERVEAFLGRSAAVREFARCDVRLPDGLLPPPAGVDPAMVRNMFQQMLDERCGTLMAAR